MNNEKQGEMLMTEVPNRNGKRILRKHVSVEGNKGKIKNKKDVCSDMHFASQT